MSKKIIAGALGVSMVVGSFAMLAVPAFAATTAWHQVTVTPASELELSGATSANYTLRPSVTAIDSNAAVIEVTANGAWKLQWMAVTGAYGTASTTGSGAGATYLGPTGFDTSTTGVYVYSGANSAASAGSNNWSAVVAGDAADILNGDVTLAWTALTGAAFSNIVTGTAVTASDVTITYSAGTDGTITADETNYGTIYYSLSTN